MSVLWIIYVLIFILGLIVGRIITTIQIGATYNDMVKKLKAKYELRQAQKTERKKARREKKQAKFIKRK